MANDEHKISLEELYGRLGSSASGLTGEEAGIRRRQYGLNVLEAGKKSPLALRFGKHLVNFFAILLWTGSALAFLAERLSPGEGYLYIGVALSVVVVLNAVFTFVQEYQAERIIESFRRMMPVTIEVLRNGVRDEMQSGDVVPGDIVFLEAGDKVPADGRLIMENSLKVDHSSLTGESEPQLRTLECTHENILESRNMVFSGTLVQSGDGAALIYATGMNTQIGRIAGLTKKIGETASPLRKELNHFIRIISIIAIALGVTFFIIGVLMGNRLMGSMIFAIGIIVANVPEGLLPTVTLCLGMASKRMAKRNALIKKLESVETLGSTTVICTDKTGTITENRITVNTLFLNMDERNVHEESIESLPGMAELLKISALCNNARKNASGEFHGDPTEAALLSFVKRHADIEKMVGENMRIREVPFDSIRRRMLSVNSANGAETAYLKGAPEVVIEKSNSILYRGEVIGITREHRDRVMHYCQRLASRGERVLALAYKDGFFGMEEGFVFVALVGMIDPPRKGVAEAVSKCRMAGIKVIMVTGDYSVTAEAIGAMAGLVERHKANIITGEELERYDDGLLKGFLGKDNLIFARTSPAQKLRIVKTLQSMGEVVTVTGDGVNDAPALKQADMGVAMGMCGTEVAKEAADIVLLDDHFATIVSAIEEGRTVFGNIRKFIAYILTSNIPEILPFIAFALLSIPLPLTVVLILSIDLGTDLLPALGLGVEAPEDDVMKRPPRPRSERLLTSNMLFMSYGVTGMIQAAAGFFSYFVVLYSGGWTWGRSLAQSDPLYSKAVTAFFVSIIICQIANVMVSRTRKESVFKKGLFSNRLVLLGILSELALVWIITDSPTAQKIFGTHALTFFEMSLAAPFALLIFFSDELRKAMLRRGNMFVAKHLSW